MKPRPILILFAASVFIIIAVFIFWPDANPRYAIEIRRFEADGTITYQPQRYEDWNHSENIAGLRRHTRDIIYHSVYFGGLQYCFSRSGHVYAMKGGEPVAASIFDREWKWSGNPHDFPYYDYSRTSPLTQW